MNFLRSKMLLIGLLVCLGCGTGVEERSYQLQPKPPAFDQLVSLLESYRDGQPLGSEVTSMIGMISDLKHSSPEKAEIAQGIFDKLTDSANSANAATIADEALGQLHADDSLQ